MPARARCAAFELTVTIAPRRRAFMRRPTARPVWKGPVVFTAREGGVWVRFTDASGRQLLQKELALGESSRFYPSDAALAAWYGSAAAGQVKVVYE